MELDIEISPGKVWLLRRTAHACLDNGRPEKASPILERGLSLRPDDEDFKSMQAEAEQELENKN